MFLSWGATAFQPSPHPQPRPWLYLQRLWFFFFFSLWIFFNSNFQFLCFNCFIFFNIRLEMWLISFWKTLYKKFTNLSWILNKGIKWRHLAVIFAGCGTQTLNNIDFKLAVVYLFVNPDVFLRFILSRFRIFSMPSERVIWPTIQTLISMKRRFKMLDVEGKCIRFVYRVREREIWRKRERGGRELFHWKTLWLHGLCMSGFSIPNYPSKPALLHRSAVETLNKPAAIDAWLILQRQLIGIKWRLRRLHTPAAIRRLLHNILVAQKRKIQKQQRASRW